MIISQISPVNNNIKSYSSLAHQSCNKASIENTQTQNNLTFAQSNAIKNSILINKINFKGNVLAPSFDIKDVQLIKDLLSKCHYGKKDLIYGDISNVKLKRTDNGLAIENFYTEDNNQNGSITGICEELTYKLGKRLEKIFGDKYIFFAIYGSNKEFPGGHTHLAILKNTPDNKLKINNILKKQKENFKLATQISDAFNSSKVYKQVAPQLQRLQEIYDNEAIEKLSKTTLGQQYIKKIQEINEKMNQLKNIFEPNELKNCLMVDPSFKRIEEFGVGNVFNDYTFDTLRTLEQVNAIPSTSRPLGGRYMGFPLGYLKDLIPEKINEENKNSIIGVLDCEEIFPFGIDINSLQKNHPFVKFITKLNENLANT